VDVLRWRKPLAGLGLAFSMTSLAWAAPPEALVQNQGALLGSFVLLSVALGGLGFAEMKANKGRSFDLEIDRLAAAAAQRQAKKSGDVSGLLDDDSIAPAAMAARVPEKAPPPPPPTAGMPPPPPPPTRAAAPPPPPPPPSEAGDSFGARLAAADDLARPATKTAPISFGGGSPVPPPPAETGSPSGGGGGWADLLQRVRSNENDQPNPFKGGAPSAIPSTEEDAPSSKPTPSGGGDAWEALLRKTAGAASGEVPPAAIPRPGVGLPSSSPFASGNTGGSGSDPEPGRAPSGESDESLPDFIKKSGRTISLDLNKGGAASNPFQKPPQ
jgi:hypothetical protein